MMRPLATLELRSAYERGDSITVIHYACENFFEINHPAGISCISFYQLGPDYAGGFSRVDAPDGADHDDSEKWLLSQYYDFLRNTHTPIVHWNMSKPDYGFAAIDARYRFVFGADAPYSIPADRLHDLDDLVALEHGEHYVDHPRLMKLATVNGLSKRYFLSGADEAARFNQGEHGEIRRSTDEKVRWIAVLAELFLSGALTTDRSVGSVAFAGANLDAVRAVVTIATRARDVHREITRRHRGRQTIELNDEYDDQDFVRSLLRLFFDDVRPEDHVPSYAGSNSRIDFVLPTVKLAIELKHTRAGLNAAALGAELLVDIQRYSSRDDIQHLICLVFDYDGVLANPRGLEADLTRSASKDGKGVTVVIVDR